MELISFCDFVVADPSAKLGQPEIKLAFFPPVARLSAAPPDRAPERRLRRFSPARHLDAERALAMGLVQKILPQDEWGGDRRSLQRA